MHIYRREKVLHVIRMESAGASRKSDKIKSLAFIRTACSNPIRFWIGATSQPSKPVLNYSTDFTLMRAITPTTRLCSQSSLSGFQRAQPEGIYVVRGDSDSSCQSGGVISMARRLPGCRPRRPPGIRQRVRRPPGRQIIVSAMILHQPAGVLPLPGAVARYRCTVGTHHYHRSR